MLLSGAGSGFGWGKPEGTALSHYGSFHTFGTVFTQTYMAV